MNRLPDPGRDFRAIICDVDNVVADAEWRRGLIDYSAENLYERWHRFHCASPADEPCWEVVEWLHDRNEWQDARIIFLTAMMERYRPLREFWLRGVCGFEFELWMRPDGDLRPSPEVKCELILDRFAPHRNNRGIVIDDRRDVLKEVYRRFSMQTHHYAIHDGFEERSHAQEFTP